MIQKKLQICQCEKAAIERRHQVNPNSVALEEDVIIPFP